MMNQYTICNQCNVKKLATGKTVKKDIKVLKSNELNSEVAVIIGTRPGLVMFAPIIHALRSRNVKHFVIHSGQHYSPNMDSQFISDLEIPQPDYRVEGIDKYTTHGGQTAEMLKGIEKILLERKPRLVLVGGDANTNLAGALAARKLQINVGHVEAGERSYDWRMPEEHNRRIIDHISDYLFATGEKAVKNLMLEGVQGKIKITGNPIVDASLQHKKLAMRKSNILNQLSLLPGKYAVLTTHREENVDNKKILRDSLEGVSLGASKVKLPVIFLMHPRTKKRLNEFDLYEWVHTLPNLIIQDAIGYLDFTNILVNSRLVFTDSGGVQQEACIHKIPCITLRKNTEWVETIDIGANVLAGNDKKTIVDATIFGIDKWPGNWEIPFGDGRTGQHIAEFIKTIFM